jgi:NADP-dependent 3-hydroxy acid dehydrogenase YdfG
MAENLRGKVALITGASSGIGEATAVALAAEGAQVALASRRVDRLQSLARRIADNGGRALPIIADVADEAQVRDMVQRVYDSWQRLDILVNNAGVALIGPVERANPDDWRRMVNINLLGLMYTTHAVLPIMKEQGEGGAIVNISSVAGRTAQAGAAAYNATKWGVNGFSEALRQEVNRYNIRVTIIEPGFVETELAGHIPDHETKKEIQERIASMRPLQSKDIAAAILYAVTQPSYVDVNELLIRPTDEL